jgi:metalloendopeptidase OMA1, mitochondrial
MNGKYPARRVTMAIKLLKIRAALRMAFSTMILILIAFLSLAISCQKAPITGRSQLILVSPQEASQMGNAAFQEVIKEEGVSDNPQYNSQLTRVSSRIVGLADTPNYNWEYRVIKGDNVVNAFALPGGKIGVYTGMFHVANSDAALATVISHEVAHVAAHHGAERVSAGILANLGAAGLQAALGSQNPAVMSAIMNAYGVGVNVGGILPFSRSQEAEADRIGLIYMAEAGYDPREAIAFWEKMQSESGGTPAPPEFLSTHPSYGTRINNLKQWLPEAMHYYKGSTGNSNW